MTGAFFLGAFVVLGDGYVPTSKSLGKNPSFTRRLTTKLRTTYEDVRASVFAYSAKASVMTGSTRAKSILFMRSIVATIGRLVNPAILTLDSYITARYTLLNNKTAQRHTLNATLGLAKQHWRC